MLSLSSLEFPDIMDDPTAPRLTLLGLILPSLARVVFGTSDMKKFWLELRLSGLMAAMAAIGYANEP